MPSEAEKELLLRVAGELEAAKVRPTWEPLPFGALVLYGGELDTISRVLREAAEGWRPTHRHVKRGSTYRVIGEAEAQVSTGVCIPFFEEGGARQPSNDWWERDVKDGDRLTVYQGADGRLWVRFSDEFNDGRFQPLPAPAGCDHA